MLKQISIKMAVLGSPSPPLAFLFYFTEDLEIMK